jgi:hypothetical protein
VQLFQCRLVLLPLHPLGFRARRVGLLATFHAACSALA